MSKKKYKGKKTGFVKQSVQSPTYIIEFGNFTSSRESALTEITSNIHQYGIKDSGILIPFAITLNNGGKIIGLGFPSINHKFNVLTGLIVLKINGMSQQSANSFYRRVEQDIRHQIGVLFKEWYETSKISIS